MLSLGEQNDDISEDELLRMMSSLGMDPGGGGGAPIGGDDEFLPLMQGMMKNLLSKDVLYPSLKEILVQVSLFHSKLHKD